MHANVGAQCPFCKAVQSTSLHHDSDGVGEPSVILCECGRYFAARVVVTYAVQAQGLFEGLEPSPLLPVFAVNWEKMPHWVKWATADEGGELWGWDEKPEPESECWWTGPEGERNMHIKTIDMTGLDWTQCIAQRPQDGDDE